MYNIMKIPKLEKYFHLLSITIVMVIIDHCIYVKIMIALQFLSQDSSSEETPPQVRKIVTASEKKVFLTPKKVKIWPQKKSLFPNPLGHVHFAKNQVKFGIFWPLEPHLQSTAAYRGSPPCAIFHNPDNKEI